MKILDVVRFGAFLGVVNFLYWIVYWELIYWGKSFPQTLSDVPFNFIGLFFTVALFIGTTWKKTRPFFEGLPLMDYELFSLGSGTLKASGSDEDLEIPESWLEGRDDVEEVEEEDPKDDKSKKKKKKSPARTVRMISKAPKSKFRLPGLRRFKQLCAVILLGFNAFLSQGALMSSEKIMFWFFLFESWICLEYLWKTRKKPGDIIG